MAGGLNIRIFFADNEFGPIRPLPNQSSPNEGRSVTTNFPPGITCGKTFWRAAGHTSPRSMDRPIPENETTTNVARRGDQTLDVAYAPRKAAYWRREPDDSSLYVRRSPRLGLISISPSGMGGAERARESRLQIGSSAPSLFTFPLAAYGGCDIPIGKPGPPPTFSGKTQCPCDATQH